MKKALLLMLLLILLIVYGTGCAADTALVNSKSFRWGISPDTVLSLHSKSDEPETSDDGFFFRSINFEGNECTEFLEFAEDAIISVRYRLSSSSYDANLKAYQEFKDTLTDKYGESASCNETDGSNLFYTTEWNYKGIHISAILFHVGNDAYNCSVTFEDSVAVEKQEKQQSDKRIQEIMSWAVPADCIRQDGVGGAYLPSVATSDDLEFFSTFLERFESQSSYVEMLEMFSTEGLQAFSPDMKPFNIDTSSVERIAFTSEGTGYTCTIAIRDKNDADAMWIYDQRYQPASGGYESTSWINTFSYYPSSTECSAYQQLLEKFHTQEIVTNSNVPVISDSELQPVIDWLNTGNVIKRVEGKSDFENFEAKDDDLRFIATYLYCRMNNRLVDALLLVQPDKLLDVDYVTPFFNMENATPYAVALIATTCLS